MTSHHAVTSRVCFGDGGQLLWTRVMGGEYRCDLTDCTYTIDHVWIGCDCSGEMRWRLQRHHGYQSWAELGDFRTLTDAKIAANIDAAERD